jgi:hypothetical protein
MPVPTPRGVGPPTDIGRGPSNAELVREFTFSEAAVKTRVLRIVAMLTLHDSAAR